jgi:hypothetical protein
VNPNTQAMKTHVIDNNTYAIFEKSDKGGVWMVHFIWGKKDFRLFVGRRSDLQSADGHGPVLNAEEVGEVVVTRLQYLNAFEWYDYEGVAGHGLSREEVRWSKGKTRRYVELPRDFFDRAVELACREFGFTRQQGKKAG